jgi:hypothetical protein
MKILNKYEAQTTLRNCLYIIEDYHDDETYRKEFDPELEGEVLDGIREALDVLHSEIVVEGNSIQDFIDNGLYDAVYDFWESH